jgi:hypothetical protein
MRYDDMMGLEMYGGSDLGAWLTGDMMKQQLMAGAVGAGGILLTATVLGKITQPASITDPMNWRRIKDLLAVGVGILGGRALHDRNPGAAMAFVGAVAGMGIADAVASWVPANADGTPMVRTSLAGGHLSGADLRALEMAVSTPMAAWRPSYEMSGLGAPMVQQRQLSAPGVTQTEMGELRAYAPYLS